MGIQQALQDCWVLYFHVVLESIFDHLMIRVKITCGFPMPSPNCGSHRAGASALSMDPSAPGFHTCEICTRRSEAEANKDSANLWNRPEPRQQVAFERSSSNLELGPPTAWSTCQCRQGRMCHNLGPSGLKDVQLPNFSRPRGQEALAKKSSPARNKKFQQHFQPIHLISLLFQLSHGLFHLISLIFFCIRMARLWELGWSSFSSQDGLHFRLPSKAGSWSWVLLKNDERSKK